MVVIMVLRIVRIQVPIVVIRSVTEGRMACLITSQMKGSVKDGCSVLVKVEKYGSQFSCTPKIRISTRPSQKYGITEVITNSGGTKLSRTLPRRQALTLHETVPSMNASLG